MKSIKKENFLNKVCDFYKKYDIHESTYSKKDNILFYEKYDKHTDTKDIINSYGNYIKTWERDEEDEKDDDNEILKTSYA